MWLKSGIVAAAGATASFSTPYNTLLAFMGDSRMAQGGTTTGSLGIGTGLLAYFNAGGLQAALPDRIGFTYSTSSRYVGSPHQGIQGTYGYPGANVQQILTTASTVVTGGTAGHLEAIAADPAATILMLVGTNNLNADSQAPDLVYPSGAAWPVIQRAIKWLTDPTYVHPETGTTAPLYNGQAKNIVLLREMPRGVSQDGATDTYQLSSIEQAALRSWHDNLYRFDYRSGDATYSNPHVVTVSLLDQASLAANPLTPPYANVQGVYDDGVHWMPAGAVRLADQIATQAAVAFPASTDQFPLVTTATAASYLNANPLLSGSGGAMNQYSSAPVVATVGSTDASGNVVSNIVPASTTVQFNNKDMSSTTVATWVRSGSNGRTIFGLHVYGTAPAAGVVRITQNPSTGSINFATQKAYAVDNASFSATTGKYTTSSVRLAVATSGNTWNYTTYGRNAYNSTRYLNSPIAVTGFHRSVTPIIDFAGMNGGSTTGMTAVSSITLSHEVGYSAGAIDFTVEIEGLGLKIVS